MKTVLITGVLGGIGSAIAKEFKEANYFVIGTDVKKANPDFCDKFIQFDINLFCSDSNYRLIHGNKIQEEIQELDVLINNAAVQILGSAEEITVEDWMETMNVNVNGPFLLIRLFLAKLKKSKGAVINIASIHHQLTKKRFLAYAASKSALIGLTKAISVDLAGTIRVNAISPAAIETQMLFDGFNNDKEKILMLNQLHPIQRIGHPYEVAKLSLFLAEDNVGFINGANIQLDGGISNVLKDLD